MESHGRPVAWEVIHNKQAIVHISETCVVDQKGAIVFAKHKLFVIFEVVNIGLQLPFEIVHLF